ncbi:AlpA family phage regulatory protein [bacterium]|nr:AlpA family phage regulatory protein [bacterium]
MAEKFLTKEEVAERTSIKQRTLRGMVQRGLFPAPVKISPQRIAYIEREVDAWMHDRMAEAGKPTILPQSTRGSFCDDEY